MEQKKRIHRIGDDTLEFLLLTLSVGTSSARSLLSKKLSAASADTAGFGRVNTLLSLAALSVILVWAVITDSIGFSLPTLLFGFFHAVFTLTSQLFLMRAMAAGDVSAVSLFYSCGFLIPTVAGTLLWHEEWSLLRLLGTAMLIPAFLLCIGSHDKKAASAQNAPGRKWIPAALAAMTASGILGLLQKLHQSSPAKGELGGYLILAFAVSALASFLLTFCGKGASSAPKRILVPAVICGLCLGLANIVNLKLSGLLPSMLLFPILNGGMTVVSALLSVMLGYEKISLRRALGLAVGILSIVLIAM